jgi:hypothetical protein
VRKKIAPAIYFGSLETKSAEYGGDIGAVLDAVVDDLDKEDAGLVVDGGPIFFLMNDVCGRSVLDGVNECDGYLASEGGNISQAGSSSQRKGASNLLPVKRPM